MREQRGGVAVRTHAEHGDVGRGKGSLGFGQGGGRVGHIGLFVYQRQEAGSCGGVLQQVAAHQCGVAVGVLWRHEPLVHQSDGDVRPIQFLLRQGFKKCYGRAAAGYGQHSVALSLQARAQAVGYGFGQCGSLSGGSGEGVPSEGWGHKRFRQGGR